MHRSVAAVQIPGSFYKIVDFFNQSLEGVIEGEE